MALYFQEKCKFVQDYLGANIVEDSLETFYDKVIILGFKTFEGETEAKILDLFQSRKKGESLNILLKNPEVSTLRRRMSNNLEGLCGEFDSIEQVAYALESEVVVRGLEEFLQSLSLERRMGFAKACDVDVRAITDHNIEFLHYKIIDNFLPPEDSFLMEEKEHFLTRLGNFLWNMCFTKKQHQTLLPSSPSIPSPISSPPQTPSTPPLPLLLPQHSLSPPPPTTPSLSTPNTQRGEADRRRKRDEESPGSPPSKKIKVTTPDSPRAPSPPSPQLRGVPVPLLSKRYARDKSRGEPLKLTYEDCYLGDK